MEAPVQDHGSQMNMPLVTVRYLYNEDHPKHLWQVAVQIGSLKGVYQLRRGTGATLLEAFERLVEDMRARAVMDADTRFREILRLTR